MKSHHVYKLHLKLLKKMADYEALSMEFATQHNALVERVHALETLADGDDRKPRTGSKKPSEVK